MLLGRVLQWQKNQTQNCTSSAVLNVQWARNLSSARESNERYPLPNMPREENRKKTKYARIQAHSRYDFDGFFIDLEILPNVLGVRNGFRKKLKGEGDMPPQQIASDIYLVAEQKPHPLYIRSGSDLILALELTLGKFDNTVKDMDLRTKPGRSRCESI